MNWLRELYKDLRFLTRHSRRLIKALIRSRLGYKRICRNLSRARDCAKSSGLPYHSQALEMESRLLGRPAQYVGQAQHERTRSDNNNSKYHQG